jgi:uncharacterized membrane protein
MLRNAMHGYLIALHVTAAALVIGTLFLQSLAVVMMLRLKSEAHREGNRILQRRIHLFIYYPILLVALASGLWLALSTGAFDQGKWLHWKLVAVVLLIGLGLLTGRGIAAKHVFKPVAMLVHIGIFLLSFWIVYLVAMRSF